MDTTGRLLFNMLSAIAQFESEIRTARQIEGILKPKCNGVQFGCCKQLTPNQVQELRDKRASVTLIKALIQEYRLSKASIYRYLNQMAGAQASLFKTGTETVISLGKSCQHFFETGP